MSSSHKERDQPILRVQLVQAYDKQIRTFDVIVTIRPHGELAVEHLSHPFRAAQPQLSQEESLHT